MASPAEAKTLLIIKLRMMTFDSERTRNPTPESAVHSESKQPLKDLRCCNSLAPDIPRTLVLEPTLTTASPVMFPETVFNVARFDVRINIPEMITIFAVFPATAEFNASSVVTVVVVPPFPPVVLRIEELVWFPTHRKTLTLRWW